MLAVNMPLLNIRGIDIQFPYEPYDVQLLYMEKVIECLQERKHGILESPTGTGKTLCLLTATIAWLTSEREANVSACVVVPQSNNDQDQKDTSPNMSATTGDDSDEIDQHDEGTNIPPSTQNTSLDLGNGQDELVNDTAAAGYADAEENTKKQSPHLQIIYATRTHTQLQQVLKELKSTVYAGQVKTCVLASRVQLCVHHTARTGKSNDAVTNTCKRLVANFEAMKLKKTVEDENNYCNRKCKTECYNGPSDAVGVLDIEDLISIGKNNECCPFYLSKKLKSNADIVFVPYNYILDPSIRHSLMSMKDRVIILDEAHNISRICEEVSSLELKETDFTRCIEEVTTVQNCILKEISSSPAALFAAKISADDLDRMKECFTRLENAMHEMKETTLTTTKNRRYIAEFFLEGEVHEENYWRCLSILEAIIQYSNISPIVYERTRSNQSAATLKKVQSVINTVFEDLSFPQEELSFKVHITKTIPLQRASSSMSQAESSTNRLETVLHYYCLNPAVNMRRLLLELPRCILLTSGTLSPISYFITELGFDDSCATLQNDHIIEAKQLFVGVLSTGPDNFPLESTYKLRDNPDYITSLGRTLQAFSRSVPGGMLVFFPTYNSMHTSIGQWREQQLPILSGHGTHKSVFVESKDKDSFDQSIMNYHELVEDEDSSGAIFMGVCKGKVSEGLDFADELARAVFVTGVPFPPKHEPTVELKRKYLDDIRRTNHKEISDSDWYTLEAIRPVNQAIGRIIRHKKDYGAIIFCDKRYVDRRLQKFLPHWLSGNIVAGPYGKVRKAFIQFMRSQKMDVGHLQDPAPAQKTPDLQMAEAQILESRLVWKRPREDVGEEDSKKILRAKRNLLPRFSEQGNDHTLQCSTVTSTSTRESFSLLMEQAAKFLPKEEQDLILEAFLRYEQSGKKYFLPLFTILTSVLFQQDSLNELMPAVCLHLKHEHAIQLRSVCETLGLRL